MASSRRSSPLITETTSLSLLNFKHIFFFFFRVFRGSDAHYLNVHFASHARSLHPFLSFSLLLDINLQSGLF